jgi:exosome complex component RRP42
MDIDTKTKVPRNLELLSVRSIDPPSRVTPPGVPNFLNTATGGTAAVGEQGMDVLREGGEMEGVWQVRRGGTKRAVVREMIARVLEKGGVAEEVLDGLEGVDLG